MVVWVINYHHYLSCKPLAGMEGLGLPFVIPDLRTLRVNWSKAIYYLKIAVALAVSNSNVGKSENPKGEPSKP